MTKFKISDSENKALERVHYEKRSLTNLIQFFVSLCKDNDTKDMLDVYISKYKDELEKVLLHESVLMEEIFKNNIPNYEGIKFDYNYYVNFTDGEVTICYGGK